MSSLILITNAPGASSDILPALALLNHSVKILPANPTALIEAPSCDVVLIDARKDLPAAKSLCKLLNSTGLIPSALIEEIAVNVKSISVVIFGISVKVANGFTTISVPVYACNNDIVTS
ncbi:MAG: hypothetical protein ACO3T8_05865, partial [Candidatus Nanopelagicales bacterium]